MSLSQFHCTSRLYLDMHGLIFETSICYWQDQPGRPPVARGRPRVRRRPRGCRQRTGAAEPGGPARRWSLRRVLDGRPRLPNVPGSRGCYRRGSSAPFPAVRSVAGVRDAVVGFEKTSLRARLRRQATRHHRVPSREDNGGRRLGRSVVGPLRQTGRLDLARPESAAEGPEDRSPGMVPPRLVGPAGCEQRLPSV